jgi:uncharacterized protein YutE (UPF0331/DUF86 family)
MSSTLSNFEEIVIHSLIPQLEADGFEVFVHPTRIMLPPFLQKFHPDAVAFKGDKKVAIEVVGDGQRKAQKSSEMAEIFASHPEWELRLIYAQPRNIDDPIPVSSRETIEQHLTRIEDSLDAMGEQAGLLAAWAVFEAAARTLVPDKFGKPQPAANLLQEMAFGGYATHDEAERLREISKIRNEVAHGRLDLVPSREMVTSLIDITRTILREND